MSQLDCNDPKAPKDVVVVDEGTGKRVPFVTKLDTATGDYEALAPAPNGVDVLSDGKGGVIKVVGRLQGQAKLVPVDGAAPFGYRKPEPVESLIKPLSAEAKQAGMESYQKLHRTVWHDMRGCSKRETLGKFEEYLATNGFLDDFVLRVTVPVRMF